MGLCGALAEEQERRQPFEIDLDVEADLSVACRTDRLDDTIDYGVVRERLQALRAEAAQSVAR